LARSRRRARRQRTVAPTGVAPEANFTSGARERTDRRTGCTNGRRHDALRRAQVPTTSPNQLTPAPRVRLVHSCLATIQRNPACRLGPMCRRERQYVTAGARTARVFVPTTDRKLIGQGRQVARVSPQPRNAFPLRSRASNTRQTPVIAVHAFASLLDQQLWCIGRDILHAQGNALLRYGFSRERAPAGASGSTAYVFIPAPDSQLILWGFAAFYGERALGGGILVRRHGRQPGWTTEHALSFPMSTLKQLPSAYLPRTAVDIVQYRALLGGMARTLAGYESWAQRELGAEYRRDCIRRRPRHIRRRHPEEVETLPSRWLAMQPAVPHEEAYRVGECA